jgi:hypothetical protein
MWRKPLVRVDVARTWALAKQQFAAVMAERDALRRELSETGRERDDILARFRELQATVLERNKAEIALVTLHRERQIVRARAAERDPAAPLQ